MLVVFCLFVFASSLLSPPFIQVNTDLQIYLSNLSEFSIIKKFQEQPQGNDIHVVPEKSTTT